MTYVYQGPRSHNNASRKVTDNTISKRKKVLNFRQREEIIVKNKNGHCAKICTVFFCNRQFEASTHRSAINLPFLYANHLIGLSREFIIHKTLKKARISFWLIGY